MEEQLKISSLGLTKRDWLVLNGILKLAENQHAMLEPDHYQSASVLFVNSDEPAVMSLWRRFHAAEPSVTPIMISKQSDSVDDAVTLKRPLVIRRVLEALKTATSTRTQMINNSAAQGVVMPGIKRILVVDDSFPVRKYMEQKLPLLSEGALSLDFASSGKEAMEKVKAQAYDQIFLDVVMPDIDGYKICKWIKSVRPYIKVVMLTGRKSPFDKVRGTMSGCDAYITKPPEDKKLRTILAA